MQKRCWQYLVSEPEVWNNFLACSIWDLNGQASQSINLLSYLQGFDIKIVSKFSLVRRQLSKHAKASQAQHTMMAPRTVGLIIDFSFLSSLVRVGPEENRSQDGVKGRWSLNFPPVQACSPQLLLPSMEFLS